MSDTSNTFHATTILTVRHQGQVAMGGDGQVTLGTAIMKAAYRHAIHTEYRFYSYGDGSLLYPNGLT